MRMDKSELLKTAEEQRLQVKTGLLPVPEPKRWAQLDNESGFAVWIIEPERIEATRKWREERKRQWIYCIRVHTSKGVKMFDGRVKAMAVAGASYAAIKEVKQQCKRMRIKTWEIQITPA